MRRGALLGALLVASTALATRAPLDALLVDDFPGPTLAVHFIAVGQGDAILVQTPRGKHVLIDSGPDPDARALTAYLDDLVVNTLDLVVNTHPHSDHIAGLPALLRKRTVGAVLDSGAPHTSGTYERMVAALEASKVPVKKARRGRTVKVEPEVSLEVLGPAEPFIRGSRSDLNANSVIIRLVYRDVSFLFTGDAEHDTEARLLEAPKSISATVLKVAHHGSSHATTDALLKAVDPLLAVVSCGRSNKYGHPAPETLARLDRRGVRTLVTSVVGDVTVSTDGRRLRIQTQPKRLAVAAVAVAPTVRAGTPPVAAASVEAVDLNLATSEQLAALRGVGPKTAARIIAARPYRSVQDLSRVKGLGPKKLARLLPNVRVGAPARRPLPPGALARLNVRPGGPLPNLVPRAPPVAVGARAGALDLNTATGEQLDELPGVGPSTAARILEWRRESGPFVRVDQLTEVKGIGPKKLAKLRPHVRVGASPGTHVAPAPALVRPLTRRERAASHVVPAPDIVLPPRAPTRAVREGLLDLNSATAEQLDELPGVGPKTAALILEWRRERGPFVTVDQLTEVKGIGPKKLAKIRAHVGVAGKGEGEGEVPPPTTGGRARPE